MMDLTLPRLECNRCEYRWIPRTEQKPKRCPRCNSPYWDSPRVRVKLLNKKSEDPSD
jgi:predicted Zn-ribbon and HTH transcriptional regulator